MEYCKGDETNREKETILCRLCLQEDGNEMLDISSKCDDGISLNDKIITVLNIEIGTATKSYNLICRECFKTVCDFFTFYQQVHENNDQLTNIQATRLNNTIEYKENIDTIDYEEKADNLDSTDEVESMYCDIVEEGECINNLITSSKESDYAPKVMILETMTITPQLPPFQQPHVHRDTSVSRPKIDLPDHLKKRTSKSNGDAKIKEFVDLKCTICQEGNLFFRTFKEMQLHYEKVHNTRGFVTCCGKKIYRKDRAMDHITIHMNPNAFKCPVCGHNSKSRVLLRIHMKQHLPSEEWPFQCTTCNQRFVLRSQLTNHEVTHLNNEEKKFICDECGKVFALKFVLSKHKLTHSKEKNFFCESCAKSFTSQAYLTAHVKQHHNEVTFGARVQCKICGLSYKNIQTLRTHESRHRDTRNHICEICSKQCSSKSSLAAHIRYVHVKSSQWKCSICSKHFRRKPELTEHMARHTGKVLYMCTYCPKTFYSSSNFSAHRKNRHPDEYNELNKCTPEPASIDDV